MHIVDRRLNPGGKSLGNRQRFLRRAQSLVRRAVRDSSADRGIREGILRTLMTRDGVWAAGK